MAFDEPGEVAQHFRTFSAPAEDHRFGSQDSQGGLQLPITPGPGRSNTLFWPPQVPVVHMLIHINLKYIIYKT